MSFPFALQSDENAYHEAVLYLAMVTSSSPPLTVASNQATVTNFELLYSTRITTVAYATASVAAVRTAIANSHQSYIAHRVDRKSLNLKVDPDHPELRTLMSAHSVLRRTKKIEEEKLAAILDV